MAKLYNPQGQDLLEKAPPQQSAVVMMTEDGQQIAFTQVAVALMVPQVVNTIAEAVVALLNSGATLGDDGKFHVPTE